LEGLVEIFLEDYKKRKETKKKERRKNWVDEIDCSTTHQNE